MKYFKGIVKRLLYVVATVLNWVVYIPTTIAFLALESCSIVIITPILWVLIGSAKLETLYSKIFNHSNEELWWRDLDDDRDSFTSMWPLWGSYIQKHYLNKLIKDETDI